MALFESAVGTKKADAPASALLIVGITDGAEAGSVMTSVGRVRNKTRHVRDAGLGVVGSDGWTLADAMRLMASLEAEQQRTWT